MTTISRLNLNELCLILLVKQCAIRSDIQLLMSSGLGLSCRSTNKRSLQPPLMNSFDLFSSQEREGEEMSGESIHELSNVEEKSYFESQPELPDRLDIENFLGKMREVGERQKTPSRSIRSQRLEDQEIIVVEEENEVGSNLAGYESVILEHIEFGNDTHPQNTPEWEEGRSRDDDKRSRDVDRLQQGNEQVKYVINLVAENPPWVNDNLSSSTPYDIESSGFKLTPNRNSKNTCIDRTEPLDPHMDRTPPINKSCIDKPISFDQQAAPFKGKLPSNSLKGRNIQNILDKWNEEIYPRLQNQYLDTSKQYLDTSNHRKGSADFQMERDAKFCHSGYNQPSSPRSRQTPESEHKETQIQTDISGEELLKNQTFLSDQIAQLRGRNIKLQEDVRTLREALRGKETEVEGLKSSQRQTLQTSQQERRWGQQSRRLSSRNRQLQRLINMQNQTIKQFQQRQENLQKKLHKTISYQPLQSTPQERSPSFFGGNEFQSIKLAKLHTFGMDEQTQLHEKCKREAEELQERIFDLEQQIAGLEIEVERRVRIISQAIHQEIQEKSARQTHTLREEINKYREMMASIENRLRDSQERWSVKEHQIKQRESEVNRMYEELLKEWKEIEQNQTEKKQRHRTEYKANSNNFFSPKITPKSRFEIERTATIEAEQDQSPSSQYCYYSTKELKPATMFSRDRVNYPKRTIEGSNNNSVSYLPPQDLSLSFRKPNPRLNQTEKFSYNFTRALGEENRWDRKELPLKSDLRQNGELSVINSKIQRLRKEINKELCSFHS